MMKTAYTDSLLAGRRYEITAARLGDSSYQNLITVGWLLFPPSFPYSADASNYHAENRIGGASEPLVEARALMYFAEKINSTYPVNRDTCKSFITTWKNKPFDIGSNLAKASLHDYAISKLTLDVLTTAGRQDDYKMIRYWFGIRVIDPNGGKVDYYPTLSEVIKYSIPNMSEVELADGSKSGTIVQAYKYDGTPVNHPYDAPVTVDVSWSDGSSSNEPYVGIVHITPQGRGSCRIQDTLGKYRNGLHNIEEKAYNDIPEKMVVMMVYGAFVSLRDPRANDEAIMTPIVEGCAKNQQNANLTDAYMRLKEVDASGTVVAYGWASKGSGLGFNEVKSMFSYVKGSGLGKVPSWGLYPAKFLDNVENYSIGDISDLGLVLCPKCKICDHIEDANFVDFGVYFGNDGSGLKSVTCEPLMKNGTYTFKAVGLINCAHCQTPYYRIFNDCQMRTEIEQMPIGISERKTVKSYQNQWVIRVPDRGAGVGVIKGYSFQEHTVGNLPMIDFFIERQGYVLKQTYPLEVGSMKKNGVRELLCTGESRKDGVPSHTYYDNNYAPDFSDPYTGDTVSQKGMGNFRGPQQDWGGIDAQTGLKTCSLCDRVGVDTTYGESEEYQRGARFNLTIDRGDGSKTFDRLNQDFFISPTPYYRIRLTTADGSRIRYLDVPPKMLGVSVGEPPPLFSIKPDDGCPNDKWMQNCMNTFLEYGEAYSKEYDIEGDFVICKGLAWSGRYDDNTRAWIVSKPNQNVRSQDTYNAYNTPINEINWTDGQNRDAVMYDGKTMIPRFPAPQCSDNVNYIGVFGSCQSVLNVSSSHEIVLSAKETEEVDTPAGPTTKIVRYWTCKTCEDSYVSCQTTADASQFVIAGSTDPTNTPPLETGAKKGLYNPEYNWHFTRFLYSPDDKDLEDLATMDETKGDLQKKIPRPIFDWLSKGKSFTSSGSQSAGGENDE